jgi:uncharacterized protein
MTINLEKRFGKSSKNRLQSVLKNKKVMQSISDLCRENELNYMGIFGSFTNGSFSKKSDIDILIEYHKDSKKSLLDMIFLEEKLSDLFKRKVDLLTKESLSPYLKDPIIGSAKVIYERK